MDFMKAVGAGTTMGKVSNTENVDQKISGNYNSKTE